MLRVALALPGDLRGIARATGETHSSAWGLMLAWGERGIVEERDDMRYHLTDAAKASLARYLERNGKP